MADTLSGAGSLVGTGILSPTQVQAPWWLQAAKQSLVWLPFFGRKLDMLMGEAVDTRKRFIQNHARSVRNLDIWENL